MLDHLPDHVSQALLPNPPRAIGVAVSGGADSMALLHLLRTFCQMNDVRLRAVTVDHGLREEAEMEAAHVAAFCSQIGVPHDTLVWEDWSGKGNLQNAAREARYAKMAAWAKEFEIDTIAVGHTADDQAETVLMRLARRSGVDGIAAMQERSLRQGITWLRPLLHTRRDVLRRYLEAHGISWVEDPSNDDDRFERIKARKALDLLTPLGIGAEALAEVAEHMSQARKALDWHTFLAAKHIISMEAGAVVLDETGLRLQPEEIQRRLMIKAITWVNRSPYGPRRNALASAMSALRKGQAATVSGCHIRRIAARIWVFRELNAVENLRSPTEELWDGRWRITPDPPAAHQSDLTVRPLGMAGLEQCPDWRSTGLPHVVLQSTPGIWSGPRLIAAPVAGHAANWQAEPGEGPDTFFAALLSH